MVRFNLNSNGFTVLELITAMMILMVVSLIAVPNISQLKGQMQAIEDARRLAEDIAELRLEATRLRTSIRIIFSSEGYSWDISNDNSIEGSRALSGASSWVGSVPTAMTFNGLGLIRGISSQKTISIENNGQKSTITINRNGFVRI